MLFETKNNIPEVYGRERDIQVITKLIDIIITFCKYRIDNMGDVYNSIKCDEALLPFLGDTLNYKYNYKDTVTANRNILDYVTLLNRNRGSELGLKMATALSLTSLSMSENNAEVITSNQEYLSILNNIEIEYDYENAIITIQYPNVYTLVSYLLDYVRPVGMYLNVEAVSQTSVDDDTMLLYAASENLSIEYEPIRDSGVNTSKVNFAIASDRNFLPSNNDEDIVIDMNQ